MSATSVDDARSTLGTAQRILIVEDNTAMARCLTRIGKNFGSVTVEATVSGALQQLVGSPPWIAFVIDLGLPDGSGFEFLSIARAKGRNAPALILTGNNEHDAINAAFDLRAQYLAKPATRAQVEQFLAAATERASSRPFLPSEPLTPPGDASRLIEERVEKLAHSCKLTQNDVDLLDASFHGFSRKEYVDAHAISPNTSFDKRMADTLDKWLVRYGLSDAEADVLNHAACGDSNDAIAEARGTATSTLVTQLGSACRKTRDDSSGKMIARLLREVAGQPSACAEFPVRRRSGVFAVAAQLPSLSERERDVVTRHSMGHSNKEIAYDLGIAHATVRTLSRRANAKLGIADRRAPVKVLKKKLDTD